MVGAGPCETVAISNNAPWLGRMALAGKGIISASAWSTAPYVARGELVKLDIASTRKVGQDPDLTIYLLYQKQRYLAPKVKVAVDFLRERCQ